MRTMDYHRACRRDYETLQRDNNKILKIAVCGRFNSGKSSLLNFLLKLDLPVKAVTATGVITKIRYKMIPIGGTVEMKDQEKHWMLQKKKQYEYITIGDKSVDGIVMSDAEAVVIPSRHPLLQKGKVEFWDTPGLEDDPKLSEITMEAIKKCDLVMFVMDGTKMGSQKEKLLLYQLEELCGGNFFVCVNRMDLLSQEEQESVKKTALRLVSGFGNDLCGRGTAVFTSANPENPQIQELASYLELLLENPLKRERCIDAARGARVTCYKRDWNEQLEEDIDEMRELEEEKEREITAARERILNQAKEKRTEKEERLKELLQQNLRNVEQYSYWKGELEGITQENGWPGKYRKLSSAAMKGWLQHLLIQLNREVRELIPQYQYTECYPLPVIEEKTVWKKMDWGKNCGLFFKKKFMETCFDNTWKAFCSTTAEGIKEELKRYINSVLLGFDRASDRLQKEELAALDVPEQELEVLRKDREELEMML